MDELLDSGRARLRVKIGAVIVLALVGLGCAVLVSTLGNSGTTAVASRDDFAGGEGADSAGGAPGSSGVVDSDLDLSMAARPIFVHILGAVAEPGLYELREGDRAVDAVAAAGGFAADADHGQLNLARFLSDGEQIFVPVIGALPPPAGGSLSGGGAGADKVNINTADAAALETLPRVGPALAERIIAWRDTNGRFTAIEELMSVTGIGAKTFEGLRELVTI